MQAIKKRLGIYLHIPFCIKKCRYCDFLSAPAEEAVRREYIQAMIKEIGSQSSEIKGYDVHTIYMGGGTPSLLDVNEIERLVVHLKEQFEVDKNQLIEFTIEINPGIVNREKMKAYKELGINRLSFGLQSVHDNELKQLGRIHSFNDFVSNYQLAREIGFTNINIDLMSGLPEQSVDGFKKSLRSVKNLNPEHISVYSLMIEPGTEFFAMYGEEPPLDEETDRMIYRLTKDVLAQEGFDRYEISNYAKPGWEAVHNSSYWSRIDYLGIGLGAASLLGKTRFQNETDLSKYLCNAIDLSKLRQDIHLLSHREQMEEFMFLGLRMTKGVSMKDFYRFFGETLTDIYGNIIQKWEKKGLLKQEDDRVYFTERGMDLCNMVLSDFIN